MPEIGDIIRITLYNSDGKPVYNYAKIIHKYKSKKNLKTCYYLEIIQGNFKGNRLNAWRSDFHWFKDRINAIAELI